MSLSTQAPAVDDTSTVLDDALTIGYLLSRGIAKSGSRGLYDGR